MSYRTVTISVVGVSGKESVKGNQGVGKSLLCNRFIRGDHDDFMLEHSSVLSQTDFGGSPVINNDHWLYWGDRVLEHEDQRVQVRVIEQTEFLDDETFDTLAGPSSVDPYPKRAARTKLESRDKLMYIQKEQLGLEVEFPQQVLPDGKCQVDAFIVVYDMSRVEGRPFENQIHCCSSILAHLVKTKKPIILAASKFDMADEGGKRSLQAMLQKKEFKNINIQTVETSSFMDVNVFELFWTAVSSVIRIKQKLKLTSFNEAVKAVCESNKDIKLAYSRLLRGVLPIDSWPVQRLSWSSLLLKLDIDRHPDYRNFVKCYGSNAAKKLYEQHVNEARDHWMTARLCALLPSLPRVFGALIDRVDVLELTWHEAKHMLLSHALFDEYFQPLGVLGKQLDPLSPEAIYEEKRSDSRIPAEILLRPEARAAFDAYQERVRMENNRERIEEDFESLLSDTPQVTPGKPIQEVSVFLQGKGIYESLAPSQASLVYDRYQNELVHKAEMEFSECLLENVELFVECIRESRTVKSYPLSENDMRSIYLRLQEDFRFRQLLRLSEMREHMIHQFACFLTSPILRHCPGKTRCTDLIVHDALQQFYQRWKHSHPSDTHYVDINIHGDVSTTVQFIADLNCLLRNEPFMSTCGPATIRCFGAEEDGYDPTNQAVPRTELHLLETPATIDDIKAKFATNSSQDRAFSDLPPVYLLVCDPGHYDLLPYMHQQGALLAESTGGIFIGVGTADSEDSHWSKGSDCSSIFGRDQLLRVCDTICSSQLDRRKCDMRIMTSLLCGDPYSPDLLFSALFSQQHHLMRTLFNPSLITSGVVPVDVVLPSTSRVNRVDLNFGSYHSWLNVRSPSPIHGHIIVYSTRRVASLAHARAAVTQLLESGSSSVTGRVILLVAMGDTEGHYGDETNLLLTEGSELASCIGAGFIHLTPDSKPEQHFSAFVNFFDQLQGMVPIYNPESVGSQTNLRTISDGYSTLSEFKNMHIVKSNGEREPRSYSEYKTNVGATVLSDSSRTSTLSSGGGRTIDHPRIGDYSSAPTMKASASQGSMSASYSSPANRPRRRMAPRMAQIRLPPLRYSNAEQSSYVTAPLATPEAIEIAPEYSIVQDALVDDEHIYATLDFASSSRSKQQSEDCKSQSSSERSENGSNKEKKRPLRSRIFSSGSAASTVEPLSTPSPMGPSASAGTPGTAQSTMYTSAIYRRPAPPARGVTTAPTLSVTASSPTSLLSPSLLRRTARTQPLVHPLQDSLSPLRQPYRPPTMGSRSITMDVINRDVVLRARQNVVAPQPSPIPGIRHSQSVESLVEADKKKNKYRDGSRGFVRKVATSFRFRKSNTTALKEKSEEDLLRPSVLASPQLGSRSLPQSPQVERRQLKKYAFGSSSGDKVSSAFSWLPSRSPKRTPKPSAPETNQGVISPTDTLETLCVNSQGVPMFLRKCVDFIEQEGGLEMEGLYRVPGNQAQLVELEKAYREKGDVDLVRLNMPVHVVATAVKNFFSCLPHPLIPIELHLETIATNSMDHERIPNALRNILFKAPAANRRTLRYFTNHLHKVADSPATAMDIVNLSKVWFPTFFRPQFENFEEMTSGMARFQKAMEAILTSAEYIFSD